MAAPSQNFSSGVTGSTSGAPIRFVGAKELRRDLKQLENPRGWSKELGRTHRKVGAFAAEKAQAEAKRGDPRVSAAHNKMLSHFAPHIRGAGTVTGARVRLRGGRGPASSGAFWGAKSRSGWNLDLYLAHLVAASRGRGDLNENWRPQFPAWVGASWDTARLDQGPYAINPAINKNLPAIEEFFGEAVDDLMARAFPNGRIGV